MNKISSHYRTPITHAASFTVTPAEPAPLVSEPPHWIWWIVTFLAGGFTMSMFWVITLIVVLT